MQTSVFLFLFFASSQFIEVARTNETLRKLPGSRNDVNYVFLPTKVSLFRKRQKKTKVNSSTGVWKNYTNNERRQTEKKKDMKILITLHLKQYKNRNVVIQRLIQ